MRIAGWPRRLVMLGVLGLVIETALLGLGLASVNHALPEPWVVGLARPVRVVFAAAAWAAGSLSRPLSDMPAGAVVGAPVRVVRDWLSTALAVDDPPRTWERVKISQLLGGLIVAFGGYAAALVLLVRGPPATRPELTLVLAFSALFRLTLVPFPPILETDMHRYVWDGAVLAEGLNPYRYAPSEALAPADPQRARLYPAGEIPTLERLARLASDPRIRPHHIRINHPAIPTIYPPLAVGLFALAARVSPGSEVAVKALVALIDMALVGLVLAILVSLRANPGQVLVYGWCPLVLKEYANSGHYDPLATVPALAALFLLARGRPVLAGALLGLGSAAKYYPILWAVLFARRLGLLGVTACVLVILMAWAPFLSAGSGLIEGLSTFARDWEFNSGLFAAVEGVLNRVWGEHLRRPYSVQVIVGQKDPGRVVMASEEHPLDAFLQAKIVCGAGALLVLVLLWARPPQTPREVYGHAMVMLAATLLLSPVTNPWYFAWLMPLVAVFVAPSWIYLSATMGLYYLYFWEWKYISWDPPSWLPGAGLLDSRFGRGLLDYRTTEYLPFYAMLIWEQRLRMRRGLAGAAGALGALARRLAREALGTRVSG